jgi:hypothetical protein
VWAVNKVEFKKETSAKHERVKCYHPAVVFFEFSFPSLAAVRLQRLLWCENVRVTRVFSPTARGHATESTAATTSATEKERGEKKQKTEAKH